MYGSLALNIKFYMEVLHNDSSFMYKYLVSEVSLFSKDI